MVFFMVSTMWGPQEAKLVYNSKTMVYGTYNELVSGAYKPTYDWGASHSSSS